MDPISEARREVEELLRSYGQREQQISEQIKELLRPYGQREQQISEQIKQIISEPMRGTAAWHVMRAINAMNQSASKIEQAQSLSASRKWNVDADPNVPTEFKRKWRSILQAEPRRKQKVWAVWSLIAGSNPGALIRPLQAANSLAPTLYSIEANAICQYLKLAEEHYRLGKGPVNRDELWERVCELHVAIFKSAPPTHPIRVLGNVGLNSLKGRGPGRPRKNVP